jgi:hypothetical protein
MPSKETHTLEKKIAAWYKEFVVREKMKISELNTFTIVAYTRKVAKLTFLFQLYARACVTYFRHQCRCPASSDFNEIY